MTAPPERTRGSGVLAEDEPLRGNPVLQLLSDPIFLALAPATLIPVTAIVACCWGKAHRASLDASLKHEMLQRGMSADEIVMVIQAGSRRSSSRKCADFSAKDQIRSAKGADLAERVRV
jgi:hypothetical protein